MYKTQKRCQQILLEMAEIQSMAKGKLTAEYRDSSRDGKAVKLGPYYKYQCWKDGRNQSCRVPAEEAESLQVAVEGYQRFKNLADEYAELTIEMTRQQTEPVQGKKKPR